MCCGGKSIPIRTQVVASDKPKQPIVIQRVSKESVDKISIKRQAVEFPKTCSTCGFPMMTAFSDGSSSRKCSNANCRSR